MRRDWLELLPLSTYFTWWNLITADIMLTNNSLMGPICKPKGHFQFSLTLFIMSRCLDDGTIIIFEIGWRNYADTFLAFKLKFKLGPCGKRYLGHFCHAACWTKLQTIISSLTFLLLYWWRLQTGSSKTILSIGFLCFHNFIMYLSLSREYDGKKDQDWDGDDCSKDQPRLDAVQKCASFCLPAWLLKIRRANFEAMRTWGMRMLCCWCLEADMRMGGGWHEVTWGWQEDDRRVTCWWHEDEMRNP